MPINAGKYGSVGKCAYKSYETVDAREEKKLWNRQKRIKFTKKKEGLWY